MITFGVGLSPRLRQQRWLVGHTRNGIIILLTACPVATLGLSWGVGFFLSIRLSGGDADDGPNVNERDNEDANTDPNPDPLRGWDCWSGDAAIETL